MNNKGESIKPRLMIIFILLLMVGISGYRCFYKYVYNSIGLNIKENNVIEYGDSNYNLKDFINSSNGNIININDYIDNTKLGKQTFDVEVKKFFISKVIPVEVTVNDTQAPIIELNNEVITITQGDSYDVLENIKSVTDKIDGNIAYRLSLDSENNYYMIDSNFDNNTAGSYEVIVTAVDGANNTTVSKFTINVEALPEPEPIVTFREITYAQAAPNANGGSIVDIARSLLGSPYVSGGTTPYGFDCSGFVQYVYAQTGQYISRSSYTQANDGVGVNLSDAQPGDIILWGYSNGHITHSSIYIGDDTMIHAANPSTGVIQSSVSGWERWSDVQVLYVRRIN